VRDPLGASG
nr:immunoglobulin heavy chain junction region [Mus musculus]